MFEILVIYEAVSKDARDLFVGEMKSSGVLEAIKNENGCVKYEYHFSLESDTAILLYEIWESIEHQKAHMATEHMKTAMQIKQKYISSVAIKGLGQL